jgi:chorismate mutase
VSDMPKANKTRAASGAHSLMRRVNARGMGAVDGRTRAMRAVSAWKADLVRDLGGDPSAQQLTLIDVATKTMLFLNHIDSWLMQQESLVNKRKRAILPILRERMALADSLARLMSQLGLQRVPKPVQPLHEFIRDIEREEAKSAPGSDLDDVSQPQLPGKDAA